MLVRRQTGFTQASVTLAILNLLLAYELFLEGLYFSRDIFEVPFPAATDIPLGFLYGPALWWYFFVATRQHNPKIKHLTQLIPAIASIAILWPFFTSPADEKISELEGIINMPSVDGDSMFFWALHIASGLVYSALCIRMLLHYKRLSASENSFKETQKTNWLLLLVILFAIIWLAALIQWLLLWFIKFPFETAFMLPNVIYAVALYIMSYWAIRSPTELFGDITDNNSNTKEIPLTNNLLTHKPSFQLSEERIALVSRLINAAMVEQELFLNPKLKLRDLALHAKTPEHHISMLLNQEYGENFFSYVNRFRIHKAKALLQDTSLSNWTMLDIALAAGFNAKSTFYSQFKLHEAMTPLQFRDQAQ